MNEQPSNQSSAGTSRAGETPHGDDQLDREPIVGATGLIEAVLRHPRRIYHQIQHSAPGRLILPSLAIAVVLAAFYGVIVGSFSGGDQWWAAPAKIAGGMVVSAAICLPSLYIFACLVGSPARLHEVAGALGGMLVLMTLLLIGFGPVAWLFSQSTESVAVMGMFHLIFWMVAAYFGVRFLLSAFRHFGLRSEAGLKVWAWIFVLVALQMTTALRPLVGTADTFLPQEKKFFVSHWLDCVNAPSRNVRR